MWMIMYDRRTTGETVYGDCLYTDFRDAYPDIEHYERYFDNVHAVPLGDIVVSLISTVKLLESRIEDLEAK